MATPSRANHAPTMEANAFSDLLHRHAGLIHKIAFAYCRNAADREDVVQEIAVQVWRAWPRYDARFRETTWIWRIALNVAISFHRKERRHHAGRAALDSEALHAIALPVTAPSDEVQTLLACIDELGPLDRALVLLWLEGNDHATTADVLGISVSNVGTRLMRIKERLRDAMERRAHSEGPHGTR